VGVKVRHIIFIALLILILNSGCIEKENGKITINLDKIKETDFEKAKIPTLKPYELRIVEVRVEPKCLQKISEYNKYDPCLFIKIEIENNQDKSRHYAIVKHAIVTKDGQQFGKYTGMMGFGGGLYEPCQESLDIFGEGFELFPGAKKETNLCFPLVSKNQSPILYIGIAEGIGENRKLKEFSFELSEYLNNSWKVYKPVQLRYDPPCNSYLNPLERTYLFANIENWGNLDNITFIIVNNKKLFEIYDKVGDEIIGKINGGRIEKHFFDFREIHWCNTTYYCEKNSSIMRFRVMGTPLQQFSDYVYIRATAYSKEGEKLEWIC